MKVEHGRRAAFVCTVCDDIFTRRVSDARRGHAFCSKRCHATSLRTGRRKVTVTCSGCSKPFLKLPSEIGRRNSTRNFCTQACYLAQVDRHALGLAGAAVPREVNPVARFLRAQKAGLARARNLTPERLHEIAMMGVAARVAKGATRGPYRNPYRREIRRGLEWFGPLLQRKEADAETE